MNDVFPTAGEARKKTVDDLFVFREIRDIEEAIIIAVGSGLITVTVNTTGMTDPTVDLVHYTIPEEYYNDWVAKTVSVATAQMDRVIEYFRVRGYKISRTSTNNRTFQWVIRW